MQPTAAICRWSRDIRGMDLEAFPQVNQRKTEGSRRKRDPCTVDRSGGQCFIDPAVGGLLAAVDALRVHPQQHLHPVTGAVSHLRGRDPAVQPERDSTMTQVVGPPRQRRGNLLRHQGQRPGSCPGMGRVTDHPACCRPEWPPICGGPELLDVLAQDHDQLGRYGYRARVLLRPVLQATVIEYFPAIGQGGACGAASGAPRAGLWPWEAPPGAPAPDQPGGSTDLTGILSCPGGSACSRLASCPMLPVAVTASTT